MSQNLVIVFAVFILPTTARKQDIGDIFLVAASAVEMFVVKFWVQLWT